MEDERIIKLVNRSINRVIGQDSVLFTNDVSELSISHKLAEYIQPRFSEYNVDCEYNRNVESEDLRKKIYLTGETNGINIIPDIIIHERGINSENLCVIEVKKVSQRDTDIEYARTKLKACTTSVSENLNFQLGILILFTTGNTPDYQIEVYKNGELS